MDMYLAEIIILNAGISRFEPYWADDLEHALEQVSSAETVGNNEKLVSVYKCVEMWNSSYGALD